MPIGESLTFLKGKYPELEGLEKDAEVTFTGKARVSEEENNITLDFTDFKFATEGLADRELKRLSGIKDAPKEENVAGGEF